MSVVPPGVAQVVLLAPLCRDEIVAGSGAPRLRPGGAGLYASWALARRGARVHLHTPLGRGDEDLLGALPPGIEVTCHPSRETTRFGIELFPERPGERRLSLLAASDPLDPGRIALPDAAVHLLFGPLLPGDLDGPVRELIERCRCPVDLGIQGLVRTVSPNGRVRPERPRGDLRLPPVRILAGDETEVEAGGAACFACAAEVVVTRAERGSSIRLSGAEEEIEVAAVTPRRPIRQRIGMGDTFLAVYGWERSLGSEPEVAGRRAAEAATRLIEEGLPDR